AEGGAERVHVGEGEREDLGFELSTDSEIGSSAEEIFGIIRLTWLERGYAEHGAGTFGIRGRDDRCMDVEESALLEEFVDSEGERIAHAEDGAEGVAAHTEMRDLAQKLHSVAFLLERITRRVGGAVNLKLAGAEFHGLAGAGRGGEIAGDSDACARRGGRQSRF